MFFVLKINDTFVVVTAVDREGPVHIIMRALVLLSLFLVGASAFGMWTCHRIVIGGELSVIDRIASSPLHLENGYGSAARQGGTCPA